MNTQTHLDSRWVFIDQPVFKQGLYAVLGSKKFFLVDDVIIDLTLGDISVDGDTLFMVQGKSYNDKPLIGNDPSVSIAYSRSKGWLYSPDMTNPEPSYAVDLSDPEDIKIVHNGNYYTVSSWPVYSDPPLPVKWPLISYDGSSAEASAVRILNRFVKDESIEGISAGTGFAGRFKSDHDKGDDSTIDVGVHTYELENYVRLVNDDSMYEYITIGWQHDGTRLVVDSSADYRMSTRDNTWASDRLLISNEFTVRPQYAELLVDKYRWSMLIDAASVDSITVKLAKIERVVVVEGGDYADTYYLDFYSMETDGIFRYYTKNKDKVIHHVRYPMRLNDKRKPIGSDRFLWVLTPAKNTNYEKPVYISSSMYNSYVATDQASTKYIEFKKAEFVHVDSGGYVLAYVKSGVVYDTCKVYQPYDTVDGTDRLEKVQNLTHLRSDLANMGSPWMYYTQGLLWI